MARQISDIQKQIQAAAVQYYADAGLTLDVTTWSRRNIVRLWTFIVAATIAIFEQIQDAFKSDLETALAAAPPASAPWLQKESFKFQYSAADPQYLVIDDDNGIYYPTIREDLRIITRCSVQTTLSNNVKIKVAKSEPPGPLSGPELDAFIVYVRDKGAAGINYTCTSTAADRVRVEAEVYYGGIYGSVIITNVQDALNAFYKGIPFNGVFKISDLERTIRSAPGVTDVVIKDVRVRKNAVALASATSLVTLNQVIRREWQTVAGYIIEEDTVGNTLSDTIILISE